MFVERPNLETCNLCNEEFEKIESSWNDQSEIIPSWSKK